MIYDSDVHAAFMEYRAKETDKVRDLASASKFTAP